MLVFRTDGCLSISKPRTIYDFLSVLITISHAQDFFSSTYALLLFSPFPMLLFSSTYESSAVPSIHGHAQHMSAAHTGTTARGHEAAASMVCMGNWVWSVHGHSCRDMGAVVGRAWRTQTQVVGSSWGTGMAASGSPGVRPLWPYMHCAFLFLFDFYRGGPYYHLGLEIHFSR